jgi:hypothetical protein
VRCNTRTYTGARICTQACRRAQATPLSFVRVCCSFAIAVCSFAIALCRYTPPSIARIVAERLRVLRTDCLRLDSELRLQVKPAVKPACCETCRTCCLCRCPPREQPSSLSSSSSSSCFRLRAARHWGSAHAALLFLLSACLPACLPACQPASLPACQPASLPACVYSYLVRESGPAVRAWIEL